MYTPNYKWKLKQLSEIGKTPFHDDLHTIDSVSKPPLIAFKYAMPVWQRFYIVLMGLIILIVGLVMLAFGLFAALVFIKFLLA